MHQQTRLDIVKLQYTGEPNNAFIDSQLQVQKSSLKQVPAGNIFLSYLISIFLLIQWDFIFSYNSAIFYQNYNALSQFYQINKIKLYSQQQINKMFKGTPYVNKIVKKRQEDRIKLYHKNNLRNVRPITTGIDVLQPISLINNKKKQMLQEDRFTEIQRENRMLLQKIQIIMSKKNTKQISLQKARMNKSLNHGFRKKQLEGIEVENAKLLKRLQQKRSSYDAQKLKEEWKKQKHIIKNLANYPFIIKDRPQKRKSNTSYSLYKDLPSNNLQSNIQLMRIRQIDGQNFLVTVRLDQEKLNILADNKATKEIKVIDLSRQQAIQFIEFECEGRLQKIYERLRYDSINGILYLVGKNAKIQYENPQKKMQNIHQEAANQLQESIIQQSKVKDQKLNSASQTKQVQKKFRIEQAKKSMQDNEFIQDEQGNTQQKKTIKNNIKVQQQTIREKKQQKGQQDKQKLSKQSKQK